MVEQQRVEAPEAYRLGQRLDGGGAGEVFEATHPRLLGQCAVKVFRAELARASGAIESYARALHKVATVGHPNIVHLIELARTPDGAPVVVMERLLGQSLASRLAHGRPLALAETVPLVKSAAGALAAAHARGIVHGELQPTNVFLASADGYPHGFVKLLNFGRAELRRHGDEADPAGVQIGHMTAPELAQGHWQPGDGRADQFSLAAIAYLMLAGRPTTDTHTVPNPIMTTPPRPLMDLARVPARVDAVLGRALSKSPADRFDSMTAFAIALEEAAGQAVRTPSARFRPEATEERFFAEGEMGMFTNPDAIDDSDVDKVPRRRAGAALAIAVSALTVLAIAGWRAPPEWRQSRLWHALHLPRALPESGPPSEDSGPDGTALVAQPAAQPERLPPAPPPTPAPAPEAPTVPVMAKPVMAKPKHRSSPRERDMVWSAQEQRLVPADYVSPADRAAATVPERPAPLPTTTTPGAP